MTTSEGTQLTAKGRATHDRIVRVASELMRERGITDTAIADVRRAASVSGSQMSHYFADKDALVREVIDHRATVVLDAQEPLFEQLDSLDGLRRWADAIVAKLRRAHCVGGCEYGSLACELGECDDRTRAELAGGFRRWESRIGDGLRAMRDRGELAPEADPEALALSLLAAVEGGALLAQTYRSTAPLEAAMATTLDRIASLATGR